MRNIGPVSREWLAEIEVHTAKDLKRVGGAASAWVQVRERHPGKVTTNLLWALLGAECDVDWRLLSPDLKEKALAEVNGCIDVARATNDGAEGIGSVADGNCYASRQQFRLG
ncbi:TfoX/Sxy family DNA transformation protein [Nodosilinea sp. FACHB-141]|uniref:TfoX/Sxy family DNA transformation protein n=1 Tax=Cyanophyceae TaxID=3028117 RepID=UPI0016844653|nr:TfoX/Sxy family DNA transformation protein [Nodosilinea sp. FACHB-141]